MIRVLLMTLVTRHTLISKPNSCILLYGMSASFQPLYFYFSIGCILVPCNFVGFNKWMNAWCLCYCLKASQLSAVWVYFLMSTSLLVGHEAMHLVSPPQHCGAGLTLIVHCCHQINSVNMEAPIFIYMKEEQWYVFYGLKVYQVVKCIEGCLCSMGTVLCQNRVSTNGGSEGRCWT